MSKLRIANRKSSVGRGKPRPTHYDLEVWKEAMRLASELYRLCQRFPDTERYTLGRELWRSAISIPSNIAEGAARGSKPEFIRFLLIARGSLLEVDTQLWLAFELGFLIDRQPWTTAIASLLAKLNALISAERRRSKQRTISD